MLAGLWADVAKYKHFAPPGNLDETIRKFEDIVWYPGPEIDKIEPRVNAAVKEMERICRGIMESRGTIYGFLNWIALPFQKRKPLPVPEKKQISDKTSES